MSSSDGALRTPATAAVLLSVLLVAAMAVASPDSQDDGTQCTTLVPAPMVPWNVRAAAFAHVSKRFWFINSTTLSFVNVLPGGPFPWKLVAGSPQGAVVRDGQAASAVRFQSLSSIVLYEPLEIIFAFDGTTLRVASRTTENLTVITRFGVPNDAQEVDGSRYVARLPWQGFGAYDGDQDILYMSAGGSHCVRVWYKTQSWSNSSSIATLVGTCGSAGVMTTGDPATTLLDTVAAISLYRTGNRNCLIIADRNGLYRLNWEDGAASSIWQVALPQGHFQPSVAGAHFWSLAATPPSNSPLLFISSTPDLETKCSVFAYTESETTTTEAVDLSVWSRPGSPPLQCKDLLLLPAAPHQVFIGAGPNVVAQANCRTTQLLDEGRDPPNLQDTGGTNARLIGGLVGGALGLLVLVAVVVGVLFIWRSRNKTPSKRSSRSPLSSPTVKTSSAGVAFRSVADLTSSDDSHELQTLRVGSEFTNQSTRALSGAEIAPSASADFRLPSRNRAADDIAAAPYESGAAEEGITALQRRKAQCLNGRFQRLKLIGRGANGSVYSILLSDGSTAAMKEMLLLEDSAAEQLAEVEREMALMTSIEHPRIVQYYCWTHDLHEMKVTIFMELVTGGSLSRLVRGMEQRISESVLCRYIYQATEGMAYIHSKGIVHRDLKGDNLLLTAAGEVKIADFATAKIVGAKTRGAQTMIGTPVFMAPEILGAEDYAWGDQDASGYGAKADVWSLGITVCELGNRGVPPWPNFLNPGMAFAHIAGASGQPVIPTCFSPEAVDFVSACCARNPRQRPTMAELLDHPWLKRRGPVNVNSESRSSNEGGEPPQPRSSK